MPPSRWLTRSAGFNAVLSREKRPYLLIGPGRWGSADRWLGIPVQWRNISGVGAIIELKNSQIHADPSQGSHFFQNITSLGIPYITVVEDSDDTLNWKQVEALFICSGNQVYPACPARSSDDNQNSGKEFHRCDFHRAVRPQD